MDVDIERIRSHIVRLTQSVRPAESAALEQARQYVSACLEEAGWRVQRSPFVAAADDGVTRLEGVNLVARHPAHESARPRFCVGAHVDSRPDSVGADDNASAVATLLEIARLLPMAWPSPAKLNLELVGFDLEENGMLGGGYHAGRMKAEGIDLRGMISLEMLGYCDDAPGSQALPRSLVGKYPDTGN